ncbi:MAG TPA: hypothetical protein VFQ53_32950 [Kofleriaceae bacterium]|nr:hypothetical protein [Kofleriaceae bacterium]
MSDSHQLFETALARLRRGRAARTAALGGSILVTLPNVVACVEPADATGAVESFDWAQYEGKRDTRMVAFTGAWRSECLGGNTRFGCGTLGIHLTVRVKPQIGADLNWKRVGVVYRLPDDLTERTAIGNYITTTGSGDEEWDVMISVPSYHTLVVFDAWYQDGKGSTFIDDNEGEFHVVNAGPDYNVIRVEPWLNTATVGDAGVSGKLSVQAVDIDYDKRLELVATTDNWATVLRFGIGSQGEKNKWYWVEDFSGSVRERWQIDLDLPGPTDKLEYAVGYFHGVVNGARTYQFWDNNGGGNYRIERAAPTP